MTKLLGAVACVALLGLAGTAQAALVLDKAETGLAFNPTGAEGPGGAAPDYFFSRASETAFGFTDSNGWVLQNLQATTAQGQANLGQVNYRVQSSQAGAAINATGGLNDAQIVFGASSAGKVMVFAPPGPTDDHNDLINASIVSGTFNIANQNVAKPNGVPVVTLPFSLGAATPDYFLSGSITLALNFTKRSGTATTGGTNDGPYTMKFNICQHISNNQCDDIGTPSSSNDYTPFNLNEPFNSLSVGDADQAINPGNGSSDISMFVYVVSESLIDCSGCDFDNDKMFLKLALWGTEPNQTPEPATLAILGLGLVGIGLARRHWRA